MLLPDLIQCIVIILKLKSCEIDEFGRKMARISLFKSIHHITDQDCCLCPSFLLRVVT